MASAAAGLCIYIYIIDRRIRLRDSTSTDINVAPAIRPWPLFRRCTPCVITISYIEGKHDEQRQEGNTPGAGRVLVIEHAGILTESRERATAPS